MPIRDTRGKRPQVPVQGTIPLFATTKNENILPAGPQRPARRITFTYFIPNIPNADFPWELQRAIISASIAFMRVTPLKAEFADFRVTGEILLLGRPILQVEEVVKGEILSPGSKESTLLNVQFQEQFFQGAIIASGQQLQARLHVETVNPEENINLSFSQTAQWGMRSWREFNPETLSNVSKTEVVPNGIEYRGFE